VKDIGSCFSLFNCAIFINGLILSIKCFVCCGLIFGQNLLALLKQLGENSKEDIWLLDCLIRLNITSIRQTDLYVKRASE